MSTINVIVGSTNPVKIAAAEQAFKSVFTSHNFCCEGVHAPSGVADQPMDTHETKLGAINRVDYCRNKFEADYFVAMEGGVDLFEEGPATFAYVVISDGKRQVVGRSANLPIPNHVYDSLLQGSELGTIMDAVFNTDNVKQKGGAIGLLTNGAQTRASAYTQALTMAMGPFLHPHLFDA